MAIEVKLPDLGDGIESGDVLDILVSEGDVIEQEQGIVELETDKATVEVPSSHAGKVLKIHVSTGDSIPIGATLISIEAVTHETPAPVPTPEPKVEPPATISEAPAEVSPPAEPATVEQPAAETPNDESTTNGGVIAAGPAIRRLAREVGVDLSTVIGSGPSGRILRDDVLTVVRKAAQGAKAKNQTDDQQSDEWGQIRTERLSKIRKTIAAKMHESWSTVPRVTNFDDADVTELEKFRQASKGDYAARGIKLTSMPFLLKAVAMSLQKHPVINAALDLENDQVIYKEYVNLGIAVDTERGLVVPSLRGADDKSIAEIATDLKTIAENARDNKFSLEDLRGSTFTISNLGAIGGSYSTPIINVPEVAILLVGRSRKMPVVVEDDKIQVRLMMPLSLSYDHRLVDGGAAARFLNDVIGYLEAPSRLLLAP